MSKATKYLLAFIALAMIATITYGADAECDGEKVQCFDNGLKVEMIEKGDGEKPKKGQMVEVHYTGKLTNGQVFDSSVNRG